MKLKGIHETAKRLHDEIEEINRLVESRKKRVIPSSMAFAGATRQETEFDEAQLRTHRQAKIKALSDFVEEVLPYLRGLKNEPHGAGQLRVKLCVEGALLLLGVSRMFLYHRKTVKTRSEGEDQILYTSLVDSAGLRMRQHRRVGSRIGFPSIADMKTFNCGCEEPCFGSAPTWRLQRIYEDFRERSMALKPRLKEHQFLLNILFCPLTNCTVKQCNKSIASLFPVSEGLIGSVKNVLNRVCADESLQDRPVREDWHAHGYTYHNHPILRYDNEVRESIANHLSMVLRADPAGGSGTNVCRVYDMEVNTHEKLRSLLSSLMNCENGGAPRMSSSTLQREINRYLDSRNLRISFHQTDHNACPNCKAMRYAIMEQHQKFKKLKCKYDALLAQKENTMGDGPSGAEIEEVKLEMNRRKEHEDQIVAALTSHSKRDMRIRGALKAMRHHFRQVENDYIKRGFFKSENPVWKSLPSHDVITHQDDMTKVDLPYFVESASADITRWRCDANAHVSAVNDDVVVFSHEQGSGPKNASCIAEEIVLDHIIPCRGEGIMIVASDNAAVGKNWLCCVALPQYIVDQGLADVVLIVFLDNNDGKWLADMLFGQLQTKRRRTTLLGIDDLLKEFESIKRKRGKVRGFALNPLSSIDFASNLESLGYETKPPKEFGFIKRNIHFAGACRPGSKEALQDELQALIGPALPDFPGMVRLSTNPPTEKPQNELPYNERYVDVPACSMSRAKEAEFITCAQELNTTAATTDASKRTASEAPLVVPAEKEYAPSGNGVVPTRTAKNVGFNGYSFRNQNGFAELSGFSSDLVRRAWLPGFLGGATTSEERSRKFVMPVSEALKCAPENWVIRRPVYHMDCPNVGPRARYPPRNLLNAQHKKGPRDSASWIVTATYPEPPFPAIKGTCAYDAMKRLAIQHRDLRKPVHVLHVLRTIFETMGRDHEHSDDWLQRKATIPPSNMIDKFHREMRVYTQREQWCPSPAVTVKQAFKRDIRVRNSVDRILQERGIPQTNNKARTRILNELFEKAEFTPGGLNAYQHIVAEDMERVAREITECDRKQREFDEQNGLLPHSNTSHAQTEH